MYENIIAWTGLAILFLLCLPISGMQKLVLWIYGLAIRLTLLGLVAAAAYLWFRPEQIPVDVTDTVRNFAWLQNLLPQPGTPTYGMCLAGLIAVVLLPLLMVVDVCRRVTLPGRAPAITAQRIEPPRSDGRPPPAPLPGRYGRRAAADAMAQAGSPKS